MQVRREKGLCSPNDEKILLRHKCKSKLFLLVHQDDEILDPFTPAEPLDMTPSIQTPTPSLDDALLFLSTCKFTHQFACSVREFHLLKPYDQQVQSRIII